MHSESTIHEFYSYDVLCIGNFAAVAADRINYLHPNQYKIGLLHFSKAIQLPSPSAFGSNIV